MNASLSLRQPVTRDGAGPLLPERRRRPQIRIRVLTSEKLPLSLTERCDGRRGGHQSPCRLPDTTIVVISRKFQSTKLWSGFAWISYNFRKSSFHVFGWNKHIILNTTAESHVVRLTAFSYSTIPTGLLTWKLKSYIQSHQNLVSWNASRNCEQLCVVQKYETPDNPERSCGRNFTVDLFSLDHCSCQESSHNDGSCYTRHMYIRKTKPWILYTRMHGILYHDGDVRGSIMITRTHRL